MRAWMLSMPVLGLLLAAACARRPDELPTTFAQVKAALAQREARISSYRLAGTVTEAGQTAEFEALYRAPERVLATLGKPAQLTVAFDGQRYFELVPAQHTLTAYALELPPAKAALFLSQKLLPFTPEGYRAPLLPANGVEVRRATHPRAPQAIELRAQVQAEEGAATVSYVLRWPSLDFLAKRSEPQGGWASEVRVEEERCEAKLGLCFPRRLSYWLGSQAGAVVALTTVEIGAPVPADVFTLRPPPGYTLTERRLTEAGASP
jgi:hypothetical protein